MSNSTSNLPAIILGVVVVAILVAFTIADRTSGTDSASAKHSASGQGDKHESSGPHSGFSGSLKDYLDKH